MLLTLCFCLATHSSGGLVTFSTPPERIEKVLPRLSEMLGRKLEASPTVRGEVVVVRVTSVEEPELLAKIAEVCDAEWKTDGSQITRLTRSDAFARDRARKRREVALRRFEGIRPQLPEAAPPLGPDRITALAHEVVAVNGMKAGTIAEQSAQWKAKLKIDKQVPAYRAFQRILKAMPPSAFADLGPGGRVVYSLNPYRMQKPLPQEARTAILELVNEHNAFVAALKKAGYVRPESPSPLDPARGAQSIDPRSYRAIVVANSATLYLFVANADHRIVASSGIDHPYNEIEGQVFEAPKEVAQVPIPVSVRTKDLAKTMLARGRANFDVAADLKDVMMRPDEVEPLSYSAAEALYGIGEVWDVDIVASVPDSLFAMTRGLARDSNAPVPFTTVGGYLKEVGRYDMRFELRDGWLVGRLGDPDRQRQERIDRRLVREYARAAASHRTPSLDEQIADGIELDLAAAHILTPICGLVWYQGSGAFGHWNNLRFLAGLSPAQRDSFLRGRPIPFSELPASSRNLLTERLFSPLNEFRAYDSARQRPELLPNGVERRQELSPLEWMDAEPTERFPSGIPGGAELVSTMQLEPLVGFEDPGRPGTLYWRGLSRVVRMLKGEDFPKIAPDGPKSGYGRFVSDGGIRLMLDPQSEFVLPINFYEFDYSDPRPLRDAPGWFQEALKQATGGG